MGDLDVGVFDWCGFQRAPFVMPLGRSAMPTLHAKFATAMLAFAVLNFQQCIALGQHWRAQELHGMSEWSRCRHARCPRGGFDEDVLSAAQEKGQSLFAQYAQTGPC